jgi:hypothetical protein
LFGGKGGFVAKQIIQGGVCMGEVVSLQDKLFQRIYKLLDEMDDAVERIEEDLVSEGLIEAEEAGEDSRDQ